MQAILQTEGLFEDWSIVLYKNPDSLEQARDGPQEPVTSIHETETDRTVQRHPEAEGADAEILTQENLTLQYCMKQGQS